MWQEYSPAQVKIVFRCKPLFNDPERFRYFMNLPQINTNLFKQLRFILLETSRAGNIGAVARAMKTMG